MIYHWCWPDGFIGDDSTSRRNARWLRRLFLYPLMAMMIVACTAGQVDPTKVSADIKTACGILVVAANIAEILKLDPTMSASAVVNLVCTGFQATAQTPAQALVANNQVSFPVNVKGKTVIINATKE